MSIYLRRSVASFLVIGLALHVSFEIATGRSLDLLFVLLLPVFAFPYVCLSLPAFFTRRNVTLGCLLGALLLLLGLDLFLWRDWTSPYLEAGIGNSLVWILECGFSVVVAFVACLLGLVEPSAPSRA